MTGITLVPAASCSEEDIAAVLKDPFVWRADGECGEPKLLFASDVASRTTTALWSFPGRRRGKDELFRSFARSAARLHQDRMTAPKRVNRLLGMDPREWRSLIGQEAGYRTVGVVEGILASVNKTAHLTYRCFELTTLATEIAADLAGEAPAVVIAELRSDVWREHAWALLNLGRYPDALDAAVRARAEAEPFPTLALDVALADYMRATVLLRQGVHAEATTLARDAARVFRDHGDVARYVKARLLEGCGFYKAGHFFDAANLWTSLADRAKSAGDQPMLAHLYVNIGNALRDMQKYDRAAWYLRHARSIFATLGLPYAAEVARVQLSLGRVVFQQGQFARALAEYQEARGAFGALEMGAGVAAAELEIMEVLIVFGRITDAETIGRDLPDVFRTYGMSGNEMEAAAFLRECAVTRRLRLPQVNHVREYLRDLPQNPAQRFIRPTVEAGE